MSDPHALLAWIDTLPDPPEDGAPAGLIPVEKPSYEAPATIPVGARYMTLFTLGRSLKARGHSPAEIRALLGAVNAERCAEPHADTRLDEILRDVMRPDRPAFTAARTEQTAPDEAAQDGARESDPPTLLGLGLGDFLGQTFPEPEPYIEGVLSDDGGGWLGGEEKLGKTYYALEEALCLALGLDVCGKFTVPTRRRVLFIEEEDPPRRTHRRLRALLRGHGKDPDDPAFRVELNAWFRLSVWAGFTLDDPGMVARLGATLADFHPTVIYLDVLRKITLRDLNKTFEASALVAVLDTFRRAHGATFRVLHHYRKSQGFRTGRGSQEIGGSFVLGAWGENSLFFEPVGRSQGVVRVEIQTKDMPPCPAFHLRIEAEGPRHAPTLVRLVATDVPTVSDFDEAVMTALPTLTKSDAAEGFPGVAPATLAAALKKSDKTIKRALDRLLDAERVVVTGTTVRLGKLYAVKPL